MPFKVIAIDGPTGVGKSTIAKLLAKTQNFLYVDTGAMYRCLAWRWEELGCAPQEEVLQKLGQETQIEFHPDGSVWCNANNVTEVIRTERISQLASQVSQFPAIRAAMKHQQRQLVAQAEASGGFGGAVMEGRDIGTVIFPQAYRKFFLEADNRIRAQRRYDQLLQKGQPANYEEVFAALEQRDAQDRGRDLAPLQAAPDAIVLDSTSLSIEEVLSQMVEAIEAS